MMAQNINFLTDYKMACANRLPTITRCFARSRIPSANKLIRLTSGYLNDFIGYNQDVVSKTD